MIAERGTPSGFCQSGSIRGIGMGAVKREMGWAPFRPDSGVHRSFPIDPLSGAGTPMSSHQTSPSGVSTTLIKMLFLEKVATAFGLDFVEVPGATPKIRSRDSLRKAGHPCQCESRRYHRRGTSLSSGRVGCIMARFVFPQALGKAAAR